VTGAMDQVITSYSGHRRAKRLASRRVPSGAAQIHSASGLVVRDAAVEHHLRAAKVGQHLRQRWPVWTPR